MFFYVINSNYVQNSELNNIKVNPIMEREGNT